MRFNKTIKRISALGLGASMVGATIFGAMAADLSNYPSQYIKDGKFTGVLVVGDRAAAEDVIGVSDIVASLQFAATKPAGDVASTLTAENAWKVGSSTKILELSENIATGDSRETLRNITQFVDDGDLNALASGTVTNGKGDAPYNQYLYLLGPGGGNQVNTGYVVYTEDDNSVTDTFLYFKSGTEIGRYLLEFTTALESDVDDSAGAATTTGLYLTDFEDTDLEMFGKKYSIVTARRTSSTTNGGKNIKLTLMGGAVKDTLVEGSTKTYTIDGKDYEVTVDFVDSNSAKLTINGEATRDLLEGETDKLSDGTTIGVSEILYQDYAGGVHNVEFFLGAQKVELQDSDVSDVASSHALKVGDDTIDDAFVIIEGTNDNSSFKISRIHVNMTADDDFYVPVGGKLSENSDLDEPEVIFTNNWDFEYKGLSDELTETIEIETSGNKRYNLKFKDGDGEDVTLPLIEATAASVLEFGEKDKALINVENKTIAKDDYLILTDNSKNRGERKSYVLQYKGADKLSSDSHVVKFKNLGNGETIEQSYTNSTPLATLKIGGADYRVYVADTEMAGLQANDFGVWVDLDSSGGLVNNASTNITTWYGMEIGIQNASMIGGFSDTSNGVIVSFKTPDNTRDGGTTQDNVETLQATDYAVNLTSDSSTKVALAVLTGWTGGQKGTALSEKTPDGETNVQYTYTSYGAKITRNSPSSEPGTLKIDYPEKQTEALVYVTAKGATFSSVAEGGAVTIQRIDVGATKLASEVANINSVNSILVGGPCANAAAAEVMGNPADCTAGFTPGVGLVQVWDVGTGNVAMLVAGYAAADTRNAAAVVSNYQDYKSQFKGAKVEVKKVGSTLTVAEPSTAAPAMEEETTTE
ncbi:hypothetical protein HYU50_02605 [Candidatus Woesearchaeota archaeon]|nr:hypothetical protein [Candidatus Woesearchaeota archaeon]